MSNLGYDPEDTSTSRRTASGNGNVACQAVLDFRHKDGANQLADMPGGAAGVPSSDYRGYKPVNDPMDLRAAFNPVSVKDPGRWQPLTYIDADDRVMTPEFVCPHWGKVFPFALTSADQFRSSTGPAKPGTDQYKKQAEDLIDLSAGLTEQQKVMVYYWAEEPPPRLWNSSPSSSPAGTAAAPT